MYVLVCKRCIVYRDKWYRAEHSSTKDPNYNPNQNRRNDVRLRLDPPYKSLSRDIPASSNISSPFLPLPFEIGSLQHPRSMGDSLSGGRTSRAISLEKVEGGGKYGDLSLSPYMPL